MKRHCGKTRFATLAATVAAITVVLSTCFSASAQTFTDDFNDGNDTGWTRYDVLQPFGFGATYSFPGGNSYKIDVPGNYTVPAIERGRSGSVVTGSNYTDFRITLDITDWNDTREYVFGPIARGKQFGLGTTDGYLLILNAADHDFQLLRVEDEAPNSNELGTADIDMTAGMDFRIVYSGVGNQLNALVYNLADLSTPLGAFSVDASNYDPQPTPTPYTSGSVGLIVAQADGPTDPHTPGAPYAATFDNFKVTVPTGVEWNALGGGAIADAFNWVGNVAPSGTGVQAKFLGAAEADANITMEGFFYELGKINFDNQHRYNLTGNLMLQNTGDAEIEVLSGSHELSGEVSLGSNLRVSGSGTLTISGPINWGGKTIQVDGAHLRLKNTTQGTVNVTAGDASLVPGSGVSVLNSLTLAGGSTPTVKFDLTNNAAVLDYSGASPVATVREQILSARGGSGLGKPWNGNGITSSNVQDDVMTSPNSTSVGYAENSALPLGHYTEFRGQPVDDTAILMAYTRTADANLDGVVNNNDVTIVGANYAPGVPKPAWALGDFDYNGFVDNNDVTLLGVFYNPSATPLAAPPSGSATGLTAVPEPTTLLLSAVGALCVLWQVRRRRWITGC